jgi:RimJ/RimL family protein N-acetyltransferase
VGVSLYSTLDLPNRRVEIGNTYLHPDVRGDVVNPESKLLMFGHAFDSGIRCVQLRVDALNARSRAAVLKLGAKQDGILRQDRITWTGRTRDTVVFSILSEEWPEVRAKLVARLDKAT